MNEWLALATAVLVCFGAAALGSWPTARGLREWYPALRKPSWNPPNAVFGPVWTLLYLAMAIAVWLVWRSERDVTLAIARAIRDELAASGRVRVALTRDDDRFLVLRDRYEAARKLGAEIVLRNRVVELTPVPAQ